MPDEKDKKNTAIHSSTEELDWVNVIWIKVRKTKEDIEKIKAILRTTNVPGLTEEIKQSIGIMDIEISKINQKFKEYTDEFKMRGKTREFDIATIQKQINQFNFSKPAASKVPPSPPEEFNPLKSYTIPQVQPENPFDSPIDDESKKKLKLKPIGEHYKTPAGEVVMATNKFTDELYLVNLSSQKVICHPKDISEIFTDELKVRRISVATTINKEKFFVDTFNHKFISGPFNFISTVLMIHRHYNIVFAQIIDTQQQRYYIDVETGKKISLPDLYQA